MAGCIYQNHKKKKKKKSTNILLQKKIKERDASKFLKAKRKQLDFAKETQQKFINELISKKMISKIRIWKVYEKNQEKFGSINYQ